MCGKCLAFTNVSRPILNRWPKLANFDRYHKGMCQRHMFFTPRSMRYLKYTELKILEVFIPSLLSDLEPTQRRGSLLRWPLLAHFAPVPADCVCRWADWRWSPLHGSSERGLHHPVCPDDPPFETGRTRGIEEWGVRGEERRRRTEQLSLSTLGQKLKTLIAWCGLEKKQKQGQKKRKENIR